LINVVSSRATRRRQDQFGARGFRVTGGKRALTHKFRLVLVETSLEPQQQTVAAVPGPIERLLIDEDFVDDPANCCRSRLLLAKRGTSRAADCANLPQAALGHHPLKAGAL